MISMSAWFYTKGNLASPLRTKLAVLLCWLVVSMIGTTSIAMYWASKGQLDACLVRIGIFEVVISCVCAAGYLLYRQQSIISQPEITSEPSNAYSMADYRSALRDGLIFQLPILTLTGLLLDGGRAFHVATIAAIAYWLMTALVFARRPKSPTYLDLLTIRYGYIATLLIVRSIGPIIWKHLGRW
jgi:hypothetical protein